MNHSKFFRERQPDETVLIACRECGRKGKTTGGIIHGFGCGNKSRDTSAPVILRFFNSIQRPKIVCLCGSTRFSKAFRDANLKETLAGNIVLTIGCDFKSDDALGLTWDVKTRLDELHKRKIDLSDEVFILNVGGYIGESTRSELNYAKKHGKFIQYLEEVK